jgi:hypothetical protein
MPSTATSAAWLPLAIARASVVPPTDVPVRPGRHSAAEAPGHVQIVAPEQTHPGRHAEAAWDRELFDPVRDEDPFEWLGFGA